MKNKKSRAQNGTSSPKTTRSRIAPSRVQRVGVENDMAAGTQTVASSRGQPSANDMAAAVKNELQMVGQQITETKKLRKSVLDLGIATRSAVLKAKAAKKNKAAGGSIAAAEAAQHTNEELGMLRTDIEAILKDLETNAMHLADGALRPGTFDIENSNAALDAFKERYADIKASHDEPVPVKQGRGKTIQGEVLEEQRSVTEPNVPMTLRGRKTSAAPKDVGKRARGGEDDEPHTMLRTRKAKVVDNGSSAPKNGRKRARGGEDDEQRTMLRTKKAKAADNDSDDSMGSELTPAEDSDDEANLDAAPDASIVAIRDGVPTSIPQPAPGDLGVVGNNVTIAMATVPGQEPVGDADVEMTSIASVEGLLPGGPTITNDTADDTADDIGGVAGDIGAGTADAIGGNGAGDTGDDAADNVDGGTTSGVVTGVDDEVVDKTAGEVSDDMAGCESGEGFDDVAQGSDGDSEPDDADPDLEEDGDSQMSDSATMDTEGSSKGPTIQPKSNHDDTSDTHGDDMRLAVGVDVDDLQKYINTQKGLVKKEDAEKMPARSAPEETKASKKETKEYKRESLRAKWDAMSKEEREKKEAFAIQCIHKYLRNPSANPVPLHIRALIREVAEFCVPACEITRELALHVLENRYHNLFCIYHQTLDKSGLIHDRAGRGTFRMTGTPFSRLANEKPTRSHPTPLVDRRPGYMHCGCPEDEALLEFYWWKTAEATSPTTKVTEGWLDHRKMDPRTRTLFFHLFLDWTNMEVNDIYLGYPVDNSFGARMAHYDTKIARLQEAKEEEERAEVRKVKREAERIREEEEAAARKKEKRSKRRHAI